MLLSLEPPLVLSSEHCRLEQRFQQEWQRVLLYCCCCRLELPLFVHYCCRLELQIFVHSRPEPLSVRLPVHWLW